MRLKRTFALGMIWITALATYGQREAVDRVRPFAPPDPREARRARAQKLKVALRFGYLAENKAAESLRGRSEYNPQGYPIFIHRFSPAGAIEAKKEYSYAADGRTVRTAFLEEYKEDADKMESWYYQFDPAGRILEYKHTDARGRIYRVGYTYDAQGRILNKQSFEIDGLPGGQEIYAYDSLGTLQEVIRLDLSQTQVGRRAFEYDAAQRLIRETHYLQGQMLLFSFRYSYDDQGRLSRKEKFGRSTEAGPRQVETWTYDAADRILSHETTIAGESGSFRETFAYDREGRKTRAKSYETDGRIFQWYVYEYDSTGTGAGFQRHNPNGSVDLQVRTKYDRDGKVLETVRLYPDGSGDHRTTFRYDDAGLPLEEIHLSFGEEEAVFWFVYERY